MSQPPSSTSFQPRSPTAATTTTPATTATTTATTTSAPASTSTTSTATPQYYPLIRPPIQFTTTPGPPLPPRPSIMSTGTTSTARPATTSTLNATSTLRPTAPTTSFVSSVAGAKQPKKVPALKGTFVKDLRPMMHAFGDHPNPAPDTVSVMEEILMDYMMSVCTTAMKKTRKNQVQIDGLREALSHPADVKKLARMEELLFMQEDIKRARAQFNEKDDRGAP
ncbi:hypothetical protein FRC08_000398 [Ceratobasidium sp. 394]|nr:hypothetical protein FRC08_000398 [Ceratobasidium sp. 394]KAG9099620.1 hypothetical protein FS749_000808 [Ceratobasidium sp. UAMH 11750]